MIKLMILACLCASAYLAQAAPADKVDCSKIDEVLDDLGAAQGISVLSEKYKLAGTDEEFTKKCQEMADAIKTLRKYNKECFSALTQQVFSAILRTRSQMNEASCKPDSDKFKEVVASNKCIKDNALDAVKAAEQRAIILSQALLNANIADEKMRTRAACCGVINNKLTFIEATKEKCSKYEALYGEYVDSYTSEAMGLICQAPEKLECDKLTPLKTEGVTSTSKFFLSPMLKIVKTLDH